MAALAADSPLSDATGSTSAVTAGPSGDIAVPPSFAMNDESAGSFSLPANMSVSTALEPTASSSSLPPSLLSAPATATVPLTRGRPRREKNIKFISPAKGRAQTTGRRAAAAVAAGNLASAGKQPVPPSFEDGGIPNNDYCEACNGKGHFLCCDGCPRSFHFSCLDPPLELDTIPADAWYCKVCESARNPPMRGPGVFGKLITKVQTENPTTFALPKEITASFKNVAAGTYGEYVNTNEFRPASGLGKTGKGGYEERDPYKLKDKAGRSVVCYKCREPANPAKRKQILACDFCELHWHIDCLSPPLVGLPAATRRWKCPIHADSVFTADKKLKHQKLVKVKEPYTRNNGDIDIIPSNHHSSHTSHKPEEYISQGLRYQVPEQVVILDFWSKVQRDKYGQPLNARRKRAASSTSFDFSDSSSLTSMEMSPEREMGPSPNKRQAIPAGSSLLDRIASKSQQSIQSERESTDASYLSDGDPPDISSWQQTTLNGAAYPKAIRTGVSPNRYRFDGPSPQYKAFVDAILSMPRPSESPAPPPESEKVTAVPVQSSTLSRSFQNLLSAAGLGPASTAKSVSPAHIATSTPRRRTLSNLSTGSPQAVLAQLPSASASPEKKDIEMSNGHTPKQEAKEAS